MNKEEYLDKLLLEHGRIEDLLHAYANEKGLSEFSNKWATKLYSDEDHSIRNMIIDLLETLDKK